MNELTNASQSASSSIEVGEVLRWIDTGKRFLLLDVRNAEDAERWRLEGLNPVETLSIPYFEFIEAQEAAIARVPRNRGEVAVLCAKGSASDFVADLLRKAGIPARNIAGGMIAYGAHLEPVKVPLAPADEGRFEIWQINRRGKGCLSYLVRAGDEAVLVDPTRDADAFRALAAKLGTRIVRILDTHVHADHISSGPKLAKELGAPYFVSAGGEFPLSQNVTPLKDGEEIRLGGATGVEITARIIATPGHTPGSTSYLIAGRYLLSGDTLFVSGVGRPDLGGKVERWGKQLFRTLRERIPSLPAETVVLPGHFASASEMDANKVVSARLDDLRRKAPELAIEREDEFLETMKAGVREAPAVYTDIIHVNLGLKTVDEEKATEWELGKNECAASAYKAKQQQQTAKAA
jgi:glyoxylase-like metal-dependent hydrolase (beta-lactamase superfamily II)/rhodanese-related sulfurtransferase